MQGAASTWTIAAVAGEGTLIGATPQSGYCPPTIHSSPYTGRVYVLSYGGGAGKYYGPITQQLSVFDGVTLQALGAVTTDDRLDLCGGRQLVLATPPGAPRQAAASVVGHDVTLVWTNVGSASDFVLDVGLVSGETAISLPLRPGTGATLSAVPSGRYFARVRGVNAFGSSPPSREVTIVVP